MKVTCPHCNQIFDLSNDVTDSIISQIKTDAFEQELHERLDVFVKKSEADARAMVSDAVSKEQQKYEKQLRDLNNKLAEARSEIKVIKSESESDIKSSVVKAVSDEREKYEKLLREANDRAVKAESELKSKNSESALALREQEISLKESYADEIAKIKNEKTVAEQERDYYKDLKARMSTKMVGETLEQHCEIEFNKIRMTAFPNAEFGKDNVVSKESGSKGDYIFREFDEDGIEIISIMFEMKNEMDTTATKHKNEQFFKELDKDRKEKKCEYAVLVSLLESDNDLYNQGIVDVSYQYEKMYVIRPQFFIPVISLLRNAALKSHDARRELVKIQNQNLDISSFKENFDAFKKGFGYNYVQAHKRLDEAVAEIDKAIARLQSVKDALTASDKQISQANKKVDDITVEKLCKNSPSLLSELQDF